MAESQRKNKVRLKIDCIRMEPVTTANLIKRLKEFMKVEVIGGDLLYATGDVEYHDYDKIWQILDAYDVIID